MSQPWGALTGVAWIFALGAVGCGSDKSQTPAQAPKGMRETAIVHEACEEKGKVVATDNNGDGKADIRQVLDGAGKVLCVATDLDHDGKIDIYSYFDASGQLRRVEAGGFDESGGISSIEYFEGGKLVRRDLATTGQNRIDTWDFFDPATGKRVRRERDSNGDSRVDQWWSWNGDKVEIHLDKNDDGEPDADDVNAEPDAGLGPVKAPTAAPDAGAPAVTAPTPEAKPAEETKPTEETKAEKKAAKKAAKKKGDTP